MSRAGTFRRARESRPLRRQHRTHLRSAPSYSRSLRSMRTLVVYTTMSLTRCAHSDSQVQLRRRADVRPALLGRNVRRRQDAPSAEGSNVDDPEFTRPSAHGAHASSAHVRECATCILPPVHTSARRCILCAQSEIANNLQLQRKCKWS